MIAIRIYINSVFFSRSTLILIEELLTFSDESFNL